MKHLFAVFLIQTWLCTGNRARGSILCLWCLITYGLRLANVLLNETHSHISAQSLHLIPSTIAHLCMRSIYAHVRIDNNFVVQRTRCSHSYVSDRVAALSQLGQTHKLSKFLYVCCVCTHGVRVRVQCACVLSQSATTHLDSRQAALPNRVTDHTIKV